MSLYAAEKKIMSPRNRTMGHGILCSLRTGMGSLCGERRSMGLNIAGGVGQEDQSQHSR